MSIILMPNLNTSRFVLTGFPGLEFYYIVFAIPFSTIYAMVFLGNCMILHVIRTEQSLHQPMFYFLAMLALTDLCMGLSTVHTVLGILWGFVQDISLDACIAQAYLIHGLSFMESSVLLAMSFDRYIAICNPLRYSSNLTNAKIVKIGVAILCRSSMLIPPVIIRFKFLNYCRSHFLSHSFCLHQDLIRLACSDIRFNSFYAVSGDLHPIIGCNAHSCLLRHDPVHSSSHCFPGGENEISADLCFSHLCCFGFLHSHHWSDHGAPIWAASLSTSSGPHGQHLHPFPTLDEPHHIQYQDSADTSKNPETVFLERNLNLHVTCV